MIVKLKKIIYNKDNRVGSEKVKRKKGFTIVELLSVIVILGIVLGITITAYININRGVDVTYYKTIEQSLLTAGTNYYSYTDDLPSVFGDQKEITAKYLFDNGYTEEGQKIVDSRGKTCDLSKSYVGAYKDSLDKTNYYVCLSCGEYESDTLPCSGTVNYRLNIRAKKKNSGEVYNLNGKTWSGEDIEITFETLNDMEEVVVEKATGEEKKCTLEEKNGVKSCSVVVTESGEYQVYARSKEIESKKEDIKVLIDKTPPLYDIENTGNIEILVQSGLTSTVKNKVKNIKDNESGIKTIEYSLEKQSAKSYYKNVEANGGSNPTKIFNFDIDKTLELGKYYLQVRVYNNAGLITEKRVPYTIYKKVVIPTSEEYCLNNIVYNGKEQIITKEEEEGLLFSNNKQTNAGNYIVTARLKENYRYSDETEGERTFTCSIAKAKTATTGSCNNITYNGQSQTLASGGESISYENNAGTNAGTYTVTVNTDSNHTYNDNSTSKTLSCNIKKKDINTIWGGTTSFTYNGQGQAPTATASSGVSGEALNIIRTTNIDAGSYTSTASIASVSGGRANKNNYNLTGTTKNYTIGKRNISVTWSSTTLTYNGQGQAPTATASSGVSGETLNITRTTNIDAGSYTSTASIASVSGGRANKNNYNLTGTTKEYTIEKKSVSVTWGTISSFKYNGQGQGPTATASSGVSGEILNITRTTNINAGSYTSTASIASVSGGRANKNNYTLTGAQKVYTIQKATPTLTLSESSGKVGISTSRRFTATASVSGTFTNTTSNTNVSISPTKKTGLSESVTITGKKTGSSTITIRFVPTNSTNYNTVSKNYTATVTTVGYKIKHYQMNNDGVNYTLAKTVTGKANIGARITGEVLEYLNFISPSAQTITLSEDETKNVINYYYDKTCFGATCDYCTYGDPMGSCFYEKQEELKLWSSGVYGDTANQNIRYIGTKANQPNNYICFGSSDCSTKNHRIIGIFGTNHQVRVINTDKYSGVWDGSEAKYYDLAKIHNTVEGLKSLYAGNFKDSLTWYNLITTTMHGLTNSKVLYNKNADQLLNIEVFAWARQFYSVLVVTSVSDLMLATGNNGLTFANGSSIIADTWLYSGPEWTYHRWNTAHAYVVDSIGRLCGNSDQYPNCGISAWYPVNNKFRINFNLNEKVLFCGGSGTYDDPYTIGWGSCTN